MRPSPVHRFTTRHVVAGQYQSCKDGLRKEVSRFVFVGVRVVGSTGRHPTEERPQKVPGPSGNRSQGVRK